MFDLEWMKVFFNVSKCGFFFKAQDVVDTNCYNRQQFKVCNISSFIWRTKGWRFVWSQALFVSTAVDLGSMHLGLQAVFLSLEVSADSVFLFSAFQCALHNCSGEVMEDCTAQRSLPSKQSVAFMWCSSVPHSWWLQTSSGNNILKSPQRETLWFSLFTQEKSWENLQKRWVG